MIRYLAAPLALLALLVDLSVAWAQDGQKHILQVYNAACGPITVTTSNPTLCTKAPCTTPPLGMARFMNMPLDLGSGEDSVTLQIGGQCDGDGPIQGTCAITLGKLLPGFAGYDTDTPAKRNYSDGMNRDYGTGPNEEGPTGSGVEGDADPSLAFMSRSQAPAKSNNLNVSVRITSCGTSAPGAPRICQAVCGGF